MFVVLVNCCELAVFVPTVVLIEFQLLPLFVEYSKAKVKLSGISANASAVARRS